MAVDLTLLVVNQGDPEEPGYLHCRTRLGLEPDRHLWDEIDLMDPEPIHDQAAVIGESAQGRKTDRYDEPLTWVSPNELAECLTLYLERLDESSRAARTATLAAKAYLEALPVGTPIILYWW